MEWETVLFWASTGVLLVTTAYQTDRKHRLLVGIFLTIGILCILVAVLGALGIWSYITPLVPSLGSAVTSIASSPVSWVSVIILALAANLAIKRPTQGAFFAAFRQKLSRGQEPAGDSFSGQGTVSDPPPFDPKGLYVGSMNCDMNHLRDESFLEISVRFFNATGHVVGVSKISGLIQVSQRGATELDTLPPPTLRHNPHAEQIQPMSEAQVIFEQRVPKHIAEKILGATAETAITFELKNIEIGIWSHSRPKEQTRLPIWDGMTFHLLSEPRISVGRLVALSAVNITLGAR